MLPLTLSIIFLLINLSSFSLIFLLSSSFFFSFFSSSCSAFAFFASCSFSSSFSSSSFSFSSFSSSSFSASFSSSASSSSSPSSSSSSFYFPFFTWFCGFHDLKMRLPWSACKSRLEEACLLPPVLQFSFLLDFAKACIFFFSSTIRRVFLTFPTYV